MRINKNKFSFQNLIYHAKKYSAPESPRLESISSNKIILCDEHTTFEKSAFFLSSELENIIALHPETTISKEMSRMNGGLRTHCATIAWEIDGAQLKKRSIFIKNYKKTFSEIKTNKIDQSIRPQDFDKLALVSSYQGTKYFAHWLHDDVPTFELAKKFGKPFSMQSEYWHHNKEYAEIFDQSWSWLMDGYIRKLYLFQDFSQNKLKVERYQKLRKKLRDKYSALNPGGFVYIKRGNTGKNIRTLNNEAELINELLKLDFKILDITSDSLTTIVENLLDAKFVLTIEGSHSTHALYTMSADAGLMVIVSPTFFSNTAKDWVESLGMNYGFVVGKQQISGGFNVDINSLLKTIELMN